MARHMRAHRVHQQQTARLTHSRNTNRVVFWLHNPIRGRSLAIGANDSGRDTRPLSQNNSHPLSQNDSHPLSQNESHPLSQNDSHSLSQNDSHPLSQNDPGQPCAFLCRRRRRCGASASRSRRPAKPTACRCYKPLLPLSYYLTLCYCAEYVFARRGPLRSADMYLVTIYSRNTP